MSTADVVIIGAGIVGAATAYFCARAGMSVRVLERGEVASGTSSHGEGNILVSDKEPGPELDLAHHSLGIWRGELAEHAHRWEFEPKGGLVVARGVGGYAGLTTLVEEQRAHGTRVELVEAEDLADHEPHLRPDLAGGAFYPDDCQVQPILATAALLRLARDAGAQLSTRTEVRELIVDRDRLLGVRTEAGPVHAGAVVNAAGPWAATVAALAGVSLPVAPRRGYVLVTEPLPPMIRHKVYAAEYVGDVGSGDGALQSSPVIEGTPAGTVLIGSSRERVGFADRPSDQALAALARNATQLFPFLARVRAIRHYHGFRPYLPDHLPAIGADARLPGLWHAGGHEGAGIGLSVGTGKLLAQAITGAEPDLSLLPFDPARFDRASAGAA
ncbi:NAD(P)/FAD-dependent oxidoreductase [Naumannella halotolerans]|uniref:NAD(P)/FAD-dependent oxidoreductase n=1 Tax=Naumannella halotolerans TaxID=993414 RepID=UPI00370D440E